MAFKLCSKGTCGLTVTDLNNENYQVEDTFTTLGSIWYTFLNSATVNVLQSVNYSGEKTIQASEINKHEIVEDDITGDVTYVTDESEFEFSIDGLYEVDHIILPTIDYILAHISDFTPSTFSNGIYFVYNDKIYKYLGMEVGVENSIIYEEISIEQLVELNPEDTTIIKEVKNTFSLCKLRECYYRLVKKLLGSFCGCKPKCNLASTYSDDIFNRDLIWMAINAIRYAIEQGQYYEAQRLLENIQGCGNVCADVFNNHSNHLLGCGCNH